jgi:hypothetical protein
MKVCGLTALPEKFKWTPTTLAAMIKEIEKICPEEGLPNSHAIDIRPLAITQGSPPM